MIRLPLPIARLFLLFVIAITPVLLPGCGGDRYACDNCEGDGTSNPDDPDAEDPSTVLELTSLNFIESAEFTAVTTTDPTQLEEFSNYPTINLRFGKYANASLNDFDKDNPQGNLMPVSAERWDDDITTLDWGTATSDLANTRLRSYYEMTSTTSEWTLNDDNNVHELRLFDDKIYEIWLGWTIKWEFFEASDKNYPDIAGDGLEVLVDDAFVPPILEDEIANLSVLLWGKDAEFTNISDDNKAEMYVIYKQFRPIDEEGNDVAVEWVALVPAQSDSEASEFRFAPLSTDNSLDNFIIAHTGAAADARIPVNDQLFISFNISGAGAGAAGANLWDNRTADIPVAAVDYTEVVSTNGSYIRIEIPIDQKVQYGLETYENPIFALIEDGVNDGMHLGWLYAVSGDIATDNPQPHYAFNDVALTDIKTAFRLWRRTTYCDDSDHNDDPGRDTICNGIGL